MQQTTHAIETTPRANQTLSKGTNSIEKDIKARGLVEIPPAAVPQLRQKIAARAQLVAQCNQRIAESNQVISEMADMLVAGAGLPEGTGLEVLDDGRIVFVPPEQGSQNSNGARPATKKSRKKTATTRKE